MFLRLNRKLFIRLMLVDESPDAVSLARRRSGDELLQALQRSKDRMPPIIIAIIIITIIIIYSFLVHIFT